jgi:hypothetical protein
MSVASATTDPKTEALVALKSDLRVIVRYVEGVAKSVAKTKAAAERLQSIAGVRRVKTLGHVGMAIASCADTEAMEHLIENLASESNVELAIPDTAVWMDKKQLVELDVNDTNNTNLTNSSMKPAGNRRFPNDPYFSKLWGLHNGQSTAAFDIDAPEAWAKFTGENATGIIVGVIDTGIDYNHEDLRDQMWINTGEIPGNGIDDDGNGYVDDVHGANFAYDSGDPMDDNIHGTHCAGTIAAVGDNGVGIAGVAWRGVKLMALKFLSKSGSGRTSDAISAVDYAVAHGARITSNSWGGGSSSSAMRVAIERAEAAGMLFIAAAGNSGSNNDFYPHYPSNYPVQNIISVASTHQAGELSDFSCFGNRSVHVAAPGSGIFSTIPGNRYKSLSGTSMATPHVSGLAALVWMYRPHLSAAQVKEVILSTVTVHPSLVGRIITNGHIHASRALDGISSMPIVRPPIHEPRDIVFEDVDGEVGRINGTIRFTAADDESDVEYYTIYLISVAGFPLDVLGMVSANGSPRLELVLNGSVTLPQYTDGITVVSGNSSGERLPWLGFSAPSLQIEDYAVPLFQLREVAWGGDTDPHHGTVGGTLAVTRAVDETSITAYNIYWRCTHASLRGAMLGSIPAIGYQKPKCRSSDPRTCDNIIEEFLQGGGIRYNRTNYGVFEDAVISLSGPARIIVNYLQTEPEYDYLRIGAVKISGDMKGPVQIDLPAGKASITWHSDQSMAGGSWSLDLFQPQQAQAEFVIPEGTKHIADGLEIVPSHGSTELSEGISVDIEDREWSTDKASASDKKKSLRGAALSSQSHGEDMPLQISGIVGQTLAVMDRLPRAAKKKSDAPALPKAGVVRSGDAEAGLRGRVKVDGIEIPHTLLPSVGQVIAAALDDVDEVRIRVNILQTKLADEQMSSSKTSSSIIDFEVTAEASESRELLDNAEASLIMLAMGGKALRRFDEALTSSLVAQLPITGGVTHSSFEEPVQFFARPNGV